MVAITTPALDIVQVLARRGRVPPGIPVPEAGQSVESDGITACWIQPGGWMLLAPRGEEGAFAARVAGLVGDAAAVIDQSHGRTVFRLVGAGAARLLAKGCRVDLHPRAFPPGAVAATAVAHLPALLRRLPQGEGFDLLVFSTFAEEMRHWLEESGGVPG